MNYITSVGVQQFSITIASGLTTGTAIINPVGSGAYINYGGVNPSVSATPSEDYAYLTLTNSTTITATRNTGTAGTIVITGSITDGDTTNLIKSVQFGTATIAAAGSSGTAPISPVTNANTATHFLGFKYGSGTLSFTALKPRLSLAGTTVTAAVAGTTAGADVVGFCIVEFQSTCLTANAVQNVSATSSSGVTSFTASFTSVTLANAVTFFGGWTIATETTSESLSFMNGALTDVSTLTISLNGGASVAKIFNVSIAEFNSGVLKSAVQRNTTVLSGATSTTATITGVTLSNSGISFLGETSSAGVSLVDRSETAAALTDGMTVTITKATATASTTTSWEVFEFPAFGSLTQILNAIWFGAIA